MKKNRIIVLTDESGLSWDSLGLLEQQAEIYLAKGTQDTLFHRKRQIASTLTFLGAALQPPVFKLYVSLLEVFLTKEEDLPKRSNPCHPYVAESLPRDTAHN